MSFPWTSFWVDPPDASPQACGNKSPRHPPGRAPAGSAAVPGCGLSPPGGSRTRFVLQVAHPDQGADPGSPRGSHGRTRESNQVHPAGRTPRPGSRTRFAPRVAHPDQGAEPGSSRPRRLRTRPTTRFGTVFAMPEPASGTGADGWPRLPATVTNVNQFETPIGLRADPAPCSVDRF